MSRHREMLYTKAQLQLILSGWECTEPLPRKGFKLFVCFAGQETGNSGCMTLTRPCGGFS